MSNFVTELRREVVGAHAAHRHSSPGPAAAAGSRCWPARSRWRWRPPRSCSPTARCRAPEQTAEPHVVKVLRIGGVPNDAVLAAGSLWVSDFDGHQVIRIDPVHRKVIARIPLGKASPATLPPATGACGHAAWPGISPASRASTRRPTASPPGSGRPVRRGAGCEPGIRVGYQRQTIRRLAPSAVFGHRAAHARDLGCRRCRCAASTRASDLGDRQR